jgi:hypothetical protein
MTTRGLFGKSTLQWLVAAVALMLGGHDGGFLVLAMPTGAPNCELNGAAPSGFHLAASPTKTVVTGSIADYGYDLVINGKIMDPSGVGNFIVGQTNVVHFQLRPSISAPEPWKGVLLIVHKTGLDTSADLTPVSPYKAAGGCSSPVSGVTHADATKKNTSAPVALLRMDQVGTDIKFNVNMVVVNSATSSIYYYTQFTLAAVAGPTSPTAAPMAPVAAPTAPVAAPMAPVAAPTAPVATPTAPKAPAPAVVPMAPSPMATPIAPTAPSPRATTIAPMAPRAPTVPVITPTAPAPQAAPVAPMTAPSAPNAPLAAAPMATVAPMSSPQAAVPVAPPPPPKAPSFLPPPPTLRPVTLAPVQPSGGGSGKGLGIIKFILDFLFNRNMGMGMGMMGMKRDL